jgi:hypothetical protein
MRVRRIATFVVAGMLLCPAAYAQIGALPADARGWWLVPTVQTAGVHEDNVVFDPSGASAGSEGRFVRVTPAMEARFRGPLRTFDGGYSLDSETHSGELSTLSDALARQTAAASFTVRTSSRTLFSGGGRYVTSRRPEDVLEDTGLVARRRRVSNARLNSAVDRHITPAVRARFGYSFEFADYGEPTLLQPGANNNMHAAVAGITFERSTRTAVGVEYTGRLLTGEEEIASLRSAGRFTAHVLTARLTHLISPRMTAVLAAGPRVSQALPSTLQIGTSELRWDPGTEVVASLGYQVPQRRLSIAYTRSQLLGYGAAGFIETQSVEGRGAYAQSRFRLSGRGGAFRNSLSDARASTYRFDAAAGVQVVRWVSVDVAYLYKHQDRPLLLSDAAGGGTVRPRTRNSIGVGITIGQSIHVE